MIQRARSEAVGPISSGSGGHRIIAAAGSGLGAVGTGDGVVEQAESAIRHAAITGDFIAGYLQFEGVGFGTDSSAASGGLFRGGEIGGGIARHRLAQFVGGGYSGLVLAQRRCSPFMIDAEAVTTDG